MLEKTPQNEQFGTEEKTVTFESASALISVDHNNKTVWINDINSEDENRGHGTKLLNQIKITYPDYTIKGTAQPTDFSNLPPKPNREEMEKADDLGVDFGKRKIINPGFELTETEKEFVADVLQRYILYKTSDPFGRLARFYRKNGFEIANPLGGPIESKPPHRIINN